jgi:hypothetical protein
MNRQGLAKAGPFDLSHGNLPTWTNPRAAGVLEAIQDILDTMFYVARLTNCVFSEILITPTISKE